MFPHMIGRRGPGAYSQPGGGSGEVDPGIEDPVIVVSASGDGTIKGKVKPGSFGKLVYPLAAVAAATDYTFKLTPHFSQLAQQGKLAMHGFGFKGSGATANDFHFVGLRGDGSTGIKNYQVYGTPPNGFNKDIGHTTVDGGAAAHGSQTGPNWLRLSTSSDGTTYDFKVSGDSGSTWVTQLAGQPLTPFSNVSGAAIFGIALWFNNADAGPFSIDIAQYASSAIAGPADGLSPTGAWSVSRPLLAAFGSGSRYTDAGGGAISSFLDQSGNSRNLTDGSTSTRRPALTTGGPIARACLDFDGSTDYLSGAALSSFVSNSAGYIIASVLPDAITLNNAASYNNHGVFGAGPYAGVYLKDAATPKRAIAQNFDNFGGDGHDEAIASLTVTVGAPAVLEWRHEGGILYMRVNGASEASISSGPTDVMTSAFTLGVGYLSGGFYNGKVFEVASFSTVPDLATRDALVADFMNHVGLIGALDKTPCSGAWSASRDLLTSFLGASRYTDAGGGAISTFIDQSGNGRNLTDGGTSGRRPALTTAGPYLRTCLDFDGSTDYLSGAALSSFISNSTGYFVISFMADSITLNDAASYANHGVLGSEAFMGLYLKNAGTPKTAIAQNFDNVAGDGHTQASAASTVNTAVPCVLEWRHEGGNLYVRVNGANEASVTSGNTNDMTKALTIGIGYLSGGMLDGKIFEAAAFSTIPSSAKRDAIVANFMAHVGAS